MLQAAHLPVNPAFGSQNSMISVVLAMGFSKSRYTFDQTVHKTIVYSA